MEALAARIAAFCLQKHYIKPDQIAWLQYGLMRRLMGMVTFLLLLPVGAFFDGWGSTFLFSAGLPLHSYADRRVPC